MVGCSGYVGGQDQEPRLVSVVAWPLRVSVIVGLARCIAYKDADCPYLNSSSSLRLGIFCSYS
jgi:hypothetical protein